MESLEAQIEHLIPSDPGGVSQWRREYVAFVTAGPPSRTIVLSSRVHVSPTSISFRFRNRIFRPYSHGLSYELAHYVDGTWEPVPHIPSDYFRLPLAIGFTNLPRLGVSETVRFDIMFGELPPGRYMFIRSHSRSYPAGLPRNIEYLAFEFEV